VRFPGGGDGPSASDDSRQPPSEPIPHLTDRGNGLRLSRWHGQDLRYICAWKKWLTWDGSHWRLDDTREIDRRAKAVASRMYAEATAAMAALGGNPTEGDDCGTAEEMCDGTDD
jgi:hypothetical protein